MSVTESVGSSRPSLTEKRLFLSDPTSYSFRPSSVETIETHMSLVFLAGDRAYKLKKPVRYPFLDFSTLQAREADCREEVRLNRRLAPDVYLGVVPLASRLGRLAVGGDGAVADWLVEMRRLPRKATLDRIIARGGPSDAQLSEICDVLARFYKTAERTRLTPAEYVRRFLAEAQLNRDLLTRAEFPARAEAAKALDQLEARLGALRGPLEQRVLEGHVVDGHGDLRPEHICLNHPVVIFDCLEFNAALRQVDPFDEIALLGVECAQLGAPGLLLRLAEELARRLGAPPPLDLVALYGSWRAILRARLSFAHLLEPTPRDPEKWTPLARRYLSIARQILDDRF